MTTPRTAQLLSMQERPTRLKARRDLCVDRVPFGRGHYWHIKDPLSLRYYQLREEEYLVFRLLDGRRSLEAIKQCVDARFAPRRLEVSQLQAFLGMLHREGLATGEVMDQGTTLLDRRLSLRRRRWLATLGSPLAIRFRGINPSKLLDWLRPHLRWMLQPWLLLLVSLLPLSALALLLSRAEIFRSRLPEYQVFLSGRNVMWMAIALVAVKLIHELAHGLACKHFGGECHEMGVMLLVFVPCLYCNVSDAWTLPNKWQRIAICGAGILVELVLASICTFLWWFSEPGLINSLCFNTMIICSLGTVLLNGNPLLRYDGYYMFADLVEIPNLQQESSAQIRQLATRLFLNREGFSGERLNAGRRPSLLVAYGIASQFYRWVVVAGILWICLVFFRNHNVAVLGHLLVILVVAGLLGTPIVRAGTMFLDPRSRRQMDLRRLTLAGSVTLVVASAVLFVPLPRRVTAPIILQPAGAQHVYVTAQGVLERVDAGPGTIVRRDQPLAQLRNEELDQEILAVTGQRNLQRRHVENLERQKMNDLTAQESLPAARQWLESLDEQLQDRMDYRARLTLRAPIDGTVLPPRSRREHTRQGDLPTWTGTPLDSKNVGCHMDVGTRFCLVGDPQRLEGILIIDQAGLESIASGQTVRIQLAGMPGESITGHIREIAEIDVRQIPPELAASGNVPMATTPTEAARPQSTSFEARVALDPTGRSLFLGATGRAKVFVQPLSLFSRLHRGVRQTFGFGLP